MKGILTYILPNNILRTIIYDIVRQYILDNTAISQIVDLGSGVFENVTASTIILQLTKHYQHDNKVKTITNIASLEHRKYDVKTIAQLQFTKNVGYTFNLYSDSVINSISQKICKNSTPLGSYCMDIIEGIVAHKHLIKEYSIPNSVPLLEGKCIKRYCLRSENKYLLWDKKQIHRSRPDYLWELEKKILIQRISGGESPIVASIDIKKSKTFASVNNLVLKETYATYYEFIVALLNSRVINWYYANNFSNKSKLTVNVSKTYLQMLPVPSIPANIKIEIDKLVNQILHRKENTNENTEQLELSIDLLLYKLYNLTYDEVLVIDPKTPTTREVYEKIDL